MATPSDVDEGWNNSEIILFHIDRGIIVGLYSDAKSRSLEHDRTVSCEKRAEGDSSNSDGWAQ